MNFRITDTFTDSLARLTGEEQKLVKTTAFDLQPPPHRSRKAGPEAGIIPGMDYVLTQHARDALAKRQILEAWVDMAMQNPVWIEADDVDPLLEHRLAPIAEFGNRVLRVVVNPQTEPWRIVTAYFDRRRTV